MSMIQQIARLLGVKMTEVHAVLRSDGDACRFLSRRGLMLGAVVAAAGPSAMVQVPKQPIAKIGDSVRLKTTFTYEEWNGKRKVA